jgi:hypothetical protein
MSQLNGSGFGVAPESGGAAHTDFAAGGVRHVVTFYGY